MTWLAAWFLAGQDAILAGEQALARIREGRGDLAEVVAASDALSAYLESQPDSLAANQVAAALLRERGLLPDAVRLLDRAVTVRPSDALRFERGRAKFEAWIAARCLLGAEPIPPPLREDLAMDQPEAKEILAALEGRAPDGEPGDSVGPWIARALGCHLRGDPQGCARYLARAAERSPSALLVRGLVRIEEARFSQALEDLQAFTDRCPWNVLGWFARGLLASGPSDLMRAVDGLRAAKGPEAWILRLEARGDYQAGNVGHALRLWRKAMEDAPDDLRLAAEYAEALARQGEKEAAAALFARFPVTPALQVLRAPLLEADPLREIEAVVAEHPEAWWVREALGRQLLRSGEAEAALGHLDEFLARLPGHRRARRERVQALRLLGRTAEAERDLGFLLELFPDDPDALFLRAQLRFDLQDAKAALADLDRILALDRRKVQHDPAFELLLTRAGADEALPRIEAAIGRDPEDLRAYLWRARALLKKGDLERAAQDVAHVLREEPENEWATRTQAEILVRQGKREEAERILGEKIDRGPKVGMYCYARAQIRRRAGNLQGALEDIERAVSVGPDREEVHFLHATILFQAGRFREAAEAYSRVLGHNPLDDLSLAGRGAAWLNAGEFERGRRDLERALAVNPENQLARRNLAQAFFSIGEDEQALRLLNRILETDPDDVPARYLRGEVWAKRGDEMGALEDWAAVLQRDPAHLAARRNRGRSLVRLGRIQEAIEEFSEGLRHHPHEADLLADRGLARLRIGDREGADDLRRYLEIRPNGSRAAEVRAALR